MTQQDPNPIDDEPSVWGDIQSPRILYLKGALFAFLCLLSASILIARHPSWQLAGLLAICVWSGCRAYYFAFYVIEHYVNDGERYAGLLDFIKRRFRR